MVSIGGVHRGRVISRRPTPPSGQPAHRSVRRGRPAATVARVAEGGAVRPQQARVDPHVGHGRRAPSVCAGVYWYIFFLRVKYDTVSVVIIVVPALVDAVVYWYTAVMVLNGIICR